MKSIVAAIKRGIKNSGVLPSFRVRQKLAAQYLRGAGLEIGALHFPQKVPEGVTVRYVDYATREENIRRFPELPASTIVETHYLENGFLLAGFAPSSQDFIIAHHVLEHADNPLQVLLNWSRLLKPQGVLMVTVPVLDRCFDRGRQLTTLEHLIEDHRLMQQGQVAEFRERNLQHFTEVIQISEPNDLRGKGAHVPELSQEILRKRLQQMQAESCVDIHYHTFSVESYTRLMEYFAADFHPGFRVMSICRSRGGAEVVAVLKRSGGGREPAEKHIESGHRND